MNMQDSKLAATPMASLPKLLLSGEPHSDPKEYRQLVGGLAFTRPDISYAVNKLSQYMHKPTKDHWQAAKSLRYLIGTVTHGLFLKLSNPPILRQTGPGTVMISPQRMPTLFTLAIKLYLGPRRSRKV